MNNLIFATTNQDKLRKVVLNLQPFGIEIVHESLEMQELQSPDGEKIVRDKAEQAFQHFQQPVLVNDDTWSIPALRGFPSTGMKLCNDFLLAEDWLRLMNGITDRRIFLISHYAYHDGKSVRVLTYEDERAFLQEARGKHQKSPSLEVIGRLHSDQSIAEEITAGRKREVEHLEFWQELAESVRLH